MGSAMIPMWDIEQNSPTWFAEKAGKPGDELKQRTALGFKCSPALHRRINIAVHFPAHDALGGQRKNVVRALLAGLSPSRDYLVE